MNWKHLISVLMTGLVLACSNKEDAGIEDPLPPPKPVDELGTGWVKLQPGIGKFHDIHFVNDSTGYACGKTVARTTDRGNNWISFPLTDDQPYYELYSTDPAHCWVVGQNKLSITTDSGRNWTFIPLSVGSAGVSDIFFFDNNNGMIAGKGGLFRSSDGGHHWTTVVGSQFISDVSFIDQQNGWYIDEKKVFHTQDAGVSFTEQHAFPDSLTRIQFISAQTGWLSDVKGAIYRTIDGGLTWDKVKTLDEKMPYALQFFSQDHGFILFSEAVYELKGGTVTKVLSLPNNPLSDIQFTDVNHGWAVSPFNNGSVYRYVK
ncbi:MAG: hypothetical protein J7578_08915 [Chitinophagaceae bacterium]|nr:hypothetical protein [Chitinophagaceae bacterium]